MSAFLSLLTMAALASPLDGAWQLQTEPPRFIIQPRGYPKGQATPAKLALTVKGTLIGGTASFWRGDVQITDKVKGTLQGEVVVLTFGQGMRFVGVLDPAKGTVKGRADGPDLAQGGKPIPFTMRR